MKRNAFIKILEEKGAVFYRHGKGHDIYQCESRVEEEGTVRE